MSGVAPCCSNNNTLSTLPSLEAMCKGLCCSCGRICGGVCGGISGGFVVVFLVVLW